MKRKNDIGYIHESMNVRDKKSTRTKSELVEHKKVTISTYTQKRC